MTLKEWNKAIAPVKDEKDWKVVTRCGGCDREYRKEDYVNVPSNFPYFICRFCKYRGFYSVKEQTK